MTGIALLIKYVHIHYVYSLFTSIQKTESRQIDIKEQAGKGQARKQTNR